MRRIRQHLSFANVVSVIALFVALGGTALASVIITKNSQVGRDTISGHRPPSGRHPNIIAGSINGKDLAKPQKAKSAGLVDTTSHGGCKNTNDDENWRTTDPVQPYRVGFYRDPYGRVHLQGTFENCGASGATVVFTLPQGYRPSNTLWEEAGNPGSTTPSSVGISADGAVTPLDVLHGGTATLDGISFRCGPSGRNGCP
jgi:hypothetical protein